MTPVCIAYGSDEEAPAVGALAEWLTSQGHRVEIVAAGSEWPEVGSSAARQVARGDADLGVVWCHTGTGVSMAANKVWGVRAALCNSVEIAEGARRWNDANVLALAISQTDAEDAIAITAAFLGTPFDEAERSAVARVEQSESSEPAVPGG